MYMTPVDDTKETVNHTYTNTLSLRLVSEAEIGNEIFPFKLGKSLNEHCENVPGSLNGAQHYFSWPEFSENKGKT